MPAHKPVTPGNSDRNSLIECYFNLGLDYAEMYGIHIMPLPDPLNKLTNAWGYLCVVQSKIEITFHQGIAIRNSWCH